MRDLKVLWTKVYPAGDHIEDAELEAMIQDAEAGLAYLLHRGSRYALTAEATIRDIDKLKSYLHARA